MQRLVVHKQFFPDYYLPNDMLVDADAMKTNNYFKEQTAKHESELGRDIYITNNRMPIEGLELVDKSNFEKKGIPFDSDNIISFLLGTDYSFLPYIQ